MTMNVSELDKRGSESVSQMAWLLGQPSLEDYLSIVRKQVIGGMDIPRSVLVDEWRAANDIYGELEVSEAGIADEIDTRPVSEDLVPVVEELRSLPRFTRSFDLLPTEVLMVELDRLIVSQQHIDLTHSARHQSRLYGVTDEEQVFRFCQGMDRDEATPKVHRTGSRKFIFSSESSDFRFHDAAVISPEHLLGVDSVRPGATVLGLMMGFSSNFLNVIRSDNRMVLYNGHHRAHALRALGFTHAPCIVQTVTRRDELNLIASGDIVESPLHYFKAARPPLLKDFFDSRLVKEFYLPRIHRMVEVSFEVREFEVTDWS